ncbi:MAG: glycoside hydrolase family 88 protein [Bacteroides sp.]|nr:glycoside hydrolase family 88 protein [Bacteroides sp.]
MKTNLICKVILSACLLSGSVSLAAQQVKSNQPMSVRLVESEMIRCPESWQLDFQPKLKWDYCHGLELQAMLAVYDRYGGQKIYDYALAYADTMVNEDGTIKMYKREEFSLDRVNSGKFIFRIYEQTKEEKYKKALALMRSQLDDHPRNADGGFWHKKVYPNQVWLDGVYMGSPFYAEYAYRNNQPQDYADVVNQFLMAARHTYDPANGLYRHACDVSRKQRWADPVTGQSKHSWGRAMGWYAMALVDALDFIPEKEAGRDSMLVILNNVAAQVKRLQDKRSGQWYQVLDKSGAKGNYLESTCSAMFIYTLFKAVRMGYIDRSYLKVALKGYDGFLKEFIKVDERGVVSISNCCAVAGLGGKNYRSGDYDYYINETVRDNDPKAIGPFILACLEWENLQRTKKTLAVEQSMNVPATQWMDSIVVARDGTGHFRTVAEAIEHVRAFMEYTTTIYIKAGTYKEKLVIPAWIENVEFVGESAENTIITWDDHANIDKMGTFRTYTVRVDGHGLTFRNLTIENNAPQMGQAVALHTEGDRLTFINCRLLGNQDTVYTGGTDTRLYFKDCYIEGTTDFIFGPSTALFKNCTIHSKRDSYITAASTPRDVKVGYVFVGCKLTAAPGVTKVYLGRPWRPYAMTCFINCEMGKHILAARWHNWGNADNEKTARYGEYGSTGESPLTDACVDWADNPNKKEAAKLQTPEQVFASEKSWIPVE